MGLKRLDNSWATPGYPLLPHALRTAWTSENLPDWVVSELGLAFGITLGALDASILKSYSPTLSNHVRNYVLNVVSMRRSEIRPLQVFDQPWPYWFDLEHLPLSTRTRNCLVYAGLFTETAQLSKVSFGRLFDIRSMGVVLDSELCVRCGSRAQSDLPESAQTQKCYEERLLSLVSEPWAHQIGPADPQFSDLIPPVSDATIFDIVDSA